MAPRLLDLFAGAGGAARGYNAAGFDVFGVDHVPQRLYPYGFAVADALDYVAEHGRSFDAIHASPPCQRYSSVRTRNPKPREPGKVFPDLVAATRAALMATGRPWVIENVPGAPLVDPVVLCGAAFELTARDEYDGQPLVLRRHRLFESPIAITPKPCRCRAMQAAGFRIAGVYGHGSSRTGRGLAPNAATSAALLGLDGLTQAAMAQAIPPAYTHHIGRDLLAALTAWPTPKELATYDAYGTTAQHDGAARPVRAAE